MFEFISQLTQPVLKTIQTIFLSLALFSGADPTPTIINNPVQEIDLTPIHQEINNLGANISALADFRSSLASEITSSATSMTLESFTSGSDSLTVGKTYGFKLGGREYVIGEASTGNTIINMTRGVSRGTGTSTVSAYQSRWGRGASVEMTDAPILIRTANILGGVQTIENVLKYDSTVATTTIDDDNKNLVNYELLTYTAFNGAGVINASATQKGVVELATQIETASSTANGSAGILAIPASNATSTYNSSTAPLRVVVTKNNGKIDPNFIDLSTFTGTNVIASTTIYATTTSGTWVKPSNLRYVIVELVGGGGGAGGSTDAYFASGGGAGGGYAKKVIPASALGATETVTIGAGGSAGVGSTNSAGGVGGTTSFGSYVSATGGSGGLAPAGYSIGSVAGGTGVNGDHNESGESSNPGIHVDAAAANTDVLISAKGGNSRFGYGGISVTKTSSQDVSSNTGTGYGAGASGLLNHSNGDMNGAAGTAGYILFTYVFF